MQKSAARQLVSRLLNTTSALQEGAGGHTLLVWACLLLQLLGTDGAVNLLIVIDERLVGQRDGALLAVEAVVVPGLPFVADHVGAFSKACLVK